MKEQDIQRLETALSVVLPATCRDILLNPPFMEDSSSYENLCLYDVDELIECNTQFRADIGGKPNLRPHERLLVIGNDLSEVYYVLGHTRQGIASS